jgi:hypothetical protein
MIGKKLLIGSAITIIFESTVLVCCVNDKTNIPENQRALKNNLNGKELRVVIADVRYLIKLALEFPCFG